ncbi:MAG: histidine phosphatase family protein [Anaerolineales bacterium]|nr:histidine phosphatase family protein [Anaerolineales bacterium]
MRLYFIRHGQSHNNALWQSKGDYSGRSEDPEMTEVGQRQAEALACFLCQSNDKIKGGDHDEHNRSGFGLTHLYTSLMVRAVATGSAVAQRLQLPLAAWSDLHEGGGIYMNDPESGEPLGLPGKGRAYFQERFPNLLLPEWLDESGWWNRPYETRAERRARARRVLAEFLQRHADSDHRVAFISHGGFYNHFLAVVLNLTDRDRQPSQTAVQALIAENVILSAETEIWFQINNAAITRIDFTCEEVKLIYLNRLEHLPPELIT